MRPIGLTLLLAPLMAVAGAAGVSEPAEGAVKKISRAEAKITVTSCMTRNIFAKDPKCAANPRRATLLSWVRRLRGPLTGLRFGVLVIVRAECRDGGRDMGPDRRDFRPVNFLVKGNVRTANFFTPRRVTLCTQSATSDVETHKYTGGQTVPIVPRNRTVRTPWTLRANGKRIAGGRATLNVRILASTSFGFPTRWRVTQRIT